MLILTDHELINTEDVLAIYFTERRSATIPGRLIARMKDGRVANSLTNNKTSHLFL